MNPTTLHVRPDGRGLADAAGRPFLWTADTAWELLHRLSPAEADAYLDTRARQGFNVVLTVALAELDGLRTAGVVGGRPFADEDPTRPEPAWFDHVADTVARAEARGLRVALLPTWGDKLTAPWGDGPRIFRLDNLSATRGYGRFLGRRLRAYRGLVWVLGGDRPAHLVGMHNPDLVAAARGAGFAPDHDWTPIWRELAAGLREGWGEDALFAFHPQGGGSSRAQLPDAEWVHLHGMQSGHGSGRDVPVWSWVAGEQAAAPPRPVLDLEPNYEDHPVNPWPSWDPASGRFDDHDVRRQVVRAFLAGAAGLCYGHHAVWQFASARHGFINHADRPWQEALERPGARQVGALRAWFEKREWWLLEPAPEWVADLNRGATAAEFAVAARLGGKTVVYLPDARRGDDAAWTATARWFDPRTGEEVGRAGLTAPDALIEFAL